MDVTAAAAAAAALVTVKAGGENSRRLEDKRAALPIHAAKQQPFLAQH
jgi:hypothetical protein